MSLAVAVLESQFSGHHGWISNTRLLLQFLFLRPRDWNVEAEFDACRIFIVGVVGFYLVFGAFIWRVLFTRSRDGAFAVGEIDAEDGAVGRVDGAVGRRIQMLVS